MLTTAIAEIGYLGITCWEHIAKYLAKLITGLLAELGLYSTALQPL